MSMIPNNRPLQTQAQSLVLLASNGISTVDMAYLLGVRGYYPSLGKSGQNDRNIYDDAIFLVSPRVHVPFNANTDPSKFGFNPKIQKGYAVLTTGVWRFELGLHRGKYLALRQSGVFTVLRDSGKIESKSDLGINIHRGGNTTTSSEGCQTIVPAQYDEFIEATKAEMEFYKQRYIKYCLINRS